MQVIEQHVVGEMKSGFFSRLQRILLTSSLMVINYYGLYVII